MIEKIINLLASVPNDKLLHSYLILILSLICYDILELFLPMWWNILATTVISTIIMILKEWYDSTRNCTHSVELKDVIAGYGGLILGLLLKLL